MSTTTAEAVRARTFDDYVGQNKMKTELRIAIDSAIARRAVFDHTLLAGPSGYGKTTLAAIIASELGDRFLELKMPMGEKDIAYAVTEFGQGVVFLDEVHNASRVVQEMLLHATEVGYFDIKGVRYFCDSNTFILATTEPLKLIAPLRQRLLHQPHFADYSDEELGEIVAGMASRLGVDLPAGHAEALARAAGGVPRTASVLVSKFRDLQITDNDTSVEAVLEYAGFDTDGLTHRHRYYLSTLRELGDESGLVNLVSMTQMSKAEIEELERLLVKRGFIKLTGKGRTLTTDGLAKILAGRPTPRTREIA